MITKFLAMSGVARAIVQVRRGAFTRALARATYFPAANIRYVPRLHAPLECRWRIDPMTGALSAFWQDPSANPRAVVVVVSDHGFVRTDHRLNLLVPFVNAGLIT